MERPDPVFFIRCNIRYVRVYLIIGSFQRDCESRLAGESLFCQQQQKSNQKNAAQNNLPCGTKFVGNEFEQPLYGWPEGQNTGRILYLSTSNFANASVGSASLLTNLNSPSMANCPYQSRKLRQVV